MELWLQYFNHYVTQGPSSTDSSLPVLTCLQVILNPLLLHFFLHPWLFDRRSLRPNPTHGSHLKLGGILAQPHRDQKTDTLNNSHPKSPRSMENRLLSCGVEVQHSWQSLHPFHQQWLQSGRNLFQPSCCQRAEAALLSVNTSLSTELSQQLV